VLDKLDEELGPHFFPANDNGGKSPRDCPSCANGRLGLKLGKFGAFIGCSNYPDCKFTRKLGIVDAEKDAASGANSTDRRSSAPIRRPARSSPCATGRTASMSSSASRRARRSPSEPRS
jgi:ssDNA-binding Zn-finger/Zn-ribbon topoisomerase 1